MVQRISFATDFSAESEAAFHHALALAAEFRCTLDIMHVHAPQTDDSWSGFPKVRDTLAQWGWLPQGARPEDVEHHTGIRIRKIEITARDVAQGLSSFVASHHPDLFVAATHGRSGLNRWLAGSVTEAVTVKTHTPTLLFGPLAKPFVDAATGHMTLTSALCPLAVKPDPRQAVDELYQFIGRKKVHVHFVHVKQGPSAYDYGYYARQPVHLLEGDVVDQIVEAAGTYRAGLIAMATEGRHGLMDALRGSTTNRVLLEAPCPLLALPG